MNQPNEFEMYRARMLIRESRDAYLDAIAKHHSRVASIACDMRKITESKRFSQNPESANEALCMMATQIERSFAEAFGVKLSADEATESKGTE